MTPKSQFQTISRELETTLDNKVVNWLPPTARPVDYTSTVSHDSTTSAHTREPTAEPVPLKVLSPDALAETLQQAICVTG